MTPKRVEDRPDLFHVTLDRVINLDHPLAKLSCPSGETFNYPQL